MKLVYRSRYKEWQLEIPQLSDKLFFKIGRITDPNNNFVKYIYTENNGVSLT